jgi:hypothetical protein
MDQLPKIVRDRLQAGAAQAGAHPDADLLTAFVERSLGDRERTLVLDHLARCTDCREVIQVAQQSVPAYVGGTAAAGEAERPRWRLGWSTLRWGALAACIVVVGAALLTPRLMHRAPVELRQTEPEAAAESRRTQGDQASTDKVTANLRDHVEAKQEQEIPRQAAAASKPAERHNQPAGFVGTLAAPPRASSQVANQVAAPPASKVAAATAPAPGRADADQSKGQQSKGQQKEGQQEKGQPGKGQQLEAAGEAISTGQSVTADEKMSPGMAEYAKAPPGSLAKAKAKDEAKAEVAAAPVFRKLAPQAIEGKSSRAEADAVQWQLADHALIRWTIAANGSVERSLDSGTTWEKVTVAEGVAFRALERIGRAVWVGGAGGVLFYSSDNGLHWTRVKPAANGVTLSDDIVGIHFADMVHGQLTTAKHETWTTQDGGRTWRTALP